MKTRKIAVISIFAGIIIVLQLLSTYINFGSFPITLTLIPIIVGGATFGPWIGSFLGLVFGIIVSLMVVVGADPSGAIMFAKHPIITVMTCLVKGMLAGLIGSLIYKKTKNKKIGIIISAIITPITNTFILYLSLLLFFDTNFTVLISAFVSINFLLELAINVIISPGLLNVIVRAQNRIQ